MRMYDLIMKKRNGNVLTETEINYVVKNFAVGNIPDYQMAALLMAIYFQGMNKDEITALTMAIAKSGDMMDLSAIKGIKVDKHSTGGVGDKTTLIVAPIVAANGVKVAKMSGRGLGHTGGTIDKLEAIPGFKTSLSEKEFFAIVNEIGLSVIGQTGNLAPADKKIYALRDVIAAVDSIPLIASSIMSKKLASGSDCILLDVKIGSGAFMKSLEKAVELAQTMVNIGENAGKKTVALITNMDIPLGKNIGNSLEVIEAVQVLQGDGPEDLRSVCEQLAANMLALAGKGEVQDCLKMVRKVIDNGEAYKYFKLMVAAQGGKTEVLDDFGKFPVAAHKFDILSPVNGYINTMDTESCGIVSSILGAGREKKDSVIDYTAGIVIHKKTGQPVEKNEVIATLYSNNSDKLAMASGKYLQAITFVEAKPAKEPLIYARISKNGISKFTI